MWLAEGLVHEEVHESLVVLFPVVAVVLRPAVGGVESLLELRECSAQRLVGKPIEVEGGPDGDEPRHAVGMGCGHQIAEDGAG